VFNSFPIYDELNKHENSKPDIFRIEMYKYLICLANYFDKYYKKSQTCL